MLRATSDTAVATSVRSPVVKRNCLASSLTACRAATMSASDVIGMRRSSVIVTIHRWPHPQQGEALLEIQRGFDVFERKAEFHHGEGHVGLDAHVEHDAPRALAPHAVDQVVAKLLEVRVRERALDRGDEDVADFQDGHSHRWTSSAYASAAYSFFEKAMPSMRSASSIPVCRSPTVRTLLRSTPSVTSVWATSA